MAVWFVKKSFSVNALLHLRCCVRFRSASVAPVEVKVDDRHGIAVMSLQNYPVNALDMKTLKSMSEKLAELQRNRCRGLVITSSVPSIFCAGLDFKELYKPEHERFKTYFTYLQSVWLQLYGSQMASVALVNGHSPAGGCLLALACDYRIMLKGKFTIGLNESRVGIVVPPWLKDGMASVIGTRKTEMALQLGTMFSVEEAHQIGLVDQIEPDLQSATTAAVTRVHDYLKIPSSARYLSKMLARQGALQKLEENREDDMIKFVTFVSSPVAQKEIARYVENLKNRKH